MIKSRIKIEDINEIFDFESAFGFVQIDSDNIFGAPIKPFNTTSYPEETGVHIYPISVHDTFDYKAKFFIKTNGDLDHANWRIADFNNWITTNENGLKRIKQITFYNDYKKVKIVGYPTPISEATEFWRDANGRSHDVVCVELKIKVTNPSLCNFNLDSEDYEVYYVQQDAFYVTKPKK